MGWTASSRACRLAALMYFCIVPGTQSLAASGRWLRWCLLAVHVWPCNGFYTCRACLRVTIWYSIKPFCVFKFDFKAQAVYTCIRFGWAAMTTCRCAVTRLMVVCDAASSSLTEACISHAQLRRGLLSENIELKATGARGENAVSCLQNHHAHLFSDVLRFNA